MNIHAGLKLTAAEQAMVSAFGDRVSRLPGDEAVTKARDAAIERLKQVGLPTRRREDWHYTDLRRMLTRFHDVAPRPAAAEARKAASAYKRLVTAARLPFFNGHFFAGLADEMPDGVAARSYALACENGEDIVRWTIGEAESDAIASLNTGFFGDGVEVIVAEGANPERAIGLAHFSLGGDDRFSAVRNIVNIGAGATASFIERHIAPDKSGHQTCAISTLEVGDGADVTWVLIQEGGRNADHLGQFRARLARGAKLTLFVMNFGGHLVREEILVDVAGEAADFQLRGVNMLSESSHTDVTMVLDHTGYGTASEEIVRNVVTGKAKGVFQGQIRVARDAQKTDARMACNTLLLSDDGEFSAKPELEIFADDVACGHGATVTEIDMSHLFYLMSRGIPEKEARRLLVKAFLAEIVEDLEDEELVEALEIRLDDWFAEHG